MRRIGSFLTVLVFAVALASCGDDKSSTLSATCTANPGSGRAPLPVDFTAQVSGGNGSYTYSWSFSDGAGGGQPDVSRLFLTPGVYTATFEARSGNQRATCNTSVTAQAVPVPPPASNGAPLAHFKTNPSPPSGKLPLTVEFNACLTSDPNGDPILFTFDVGEDGPDESGHCRKEHTYRKKGTYQAKVCVNDGMAGHADQCQSYSVVVN
jgi:PKD repeat protein